jgi:hypothetical protein
MAVPVAGGAGSTVGSAAATSAAVMVCWFATGPRGVTCIAR